MDRCNNLFEEYCSTDYKNVIKKQGLKEEDVEKANHNILPILYNYGKIVEAVKKLSLKQKIISNNEGLTDLSNYFEKLPEDFENLKNNFLDEFYYYAKIARGWGKILTMIYFCLLCISVTFAGISMMFYACLKRQGYLLTFMHVLWNIIRFFMFSFFFYGAAYGMCYLGLRDAVAYVMFVFGEENLDLQKESYLIGGKDYLHYCLINNDHDYKKKLNPILTSALDDYFDSCSDLNSIYSKTIPELYITGTDSVLVSAHNELIDFINEKRKDICSNQYFGDFTEFAKRKGGLFGFLDCSFLKSDLHMMYRTIYDLSVEARILCALSCCIGFFGAIFVYFFLLVLHHYNTEIFFDTGKSIFTGFEGYGNTKKKSHNDPSYKKRKIRSEIELSSRNEEYSYKLANKNDE